MTKTIVFTMVMVKPNKCGTTQVSVEKRVSRKLQTHRIQQTVSQR